MSRQMSVFVSRFLNDLGYSQHMVNLRQRYNASPTTVGDLCCIMKYGSKREGLSMPFENDIDVMAVSMSMECRETCDDTPRENQHTIFKLERLNTTAHGYVLLQYIQHKGDSDWMMRESLVELDGLFFLSSDSWKQTHKESSSYVSSLFGYDKCFTRCRDSQGPSSPSVVLHGLISIDEVFAIRCPCPRLIASWKHRRRFHDWPSPELIDIVSSLEAHVVPIGYKDSPLHFLEWKICCTLGEIRLIESLNDCQTKLIILLKMIAKHVLKPICKEISSYVVKNLVLWMAEKKPSKTFVEDKLLVLLKHALKLLKSCIINKELPSYMIEERNLFADRISDSQVLNLCETIEILLNEGSMMLLRCPKIRDGLNTLRLAPDQFYLISEKRRCLELITLDMECSSMQHTVQQLVSGDCFTLQQMMGSLFSQDFFMQRSFRIAQLLLPDLLELMGRDGNWMNACKERMIYYLS